MRFLARETGAAENHERPKTYSIIVALTHLQAAQ